MRTKLNQFKIGRNNTEGLHRFGSKKGRARRNRDGLMESRLHRRREGPGGGDPSQPSGGGCQLARMSCDHVAVT